MKERITDDYKWKEKQLLMILQMSSTAEQSKAINSMEKRGGQFLMKYRWRQKPNRLDFLIHKQALLEVSIHGGCQPVLVFRQTTQVCRQGNRSF